MFSEIALRWIGLARSLLSVQAIVAPMSFSPLSVFEKDDRVKMNSENLPFSAVGKLIVASRFYGVSDCTGTLVWYDLVLTVAHCVVGTSGTPVTDNISFYPNHSNFRSIKDRVFSKITEIKTGTLFLKGENGDLDWAILRLEKPLGKDFGFLPGKVAKDINLIYGLIQGIGYSSDFKNSEKAGVDPSCSLFSPEAGHPLIYLSDCNGRPGISGGPALCPGALPTDPPANCGIIVRQKVD